MNKKTLGKIALGTIVGFGVAFYGLNYLRTNKPTDIYYINADETNVSGKEHDDLVVGFGKNQTSELYLRNKDGEFENVNLVRKREERDNDKWYNEQFKDVEKTIKGLKKTLDDLTE